MAPPIQPASLHHGALCGRSGVSRGENGRSRGPRAQNASEGLRTLCARRRAPARAAPQIGVVLYEHEKAAELRRHYAADSDLSRLAGRLTPVHTQIGENLPVRGVQRRRIASAGSELRTRGRATRRELPARRLTVAPLTQNPHVSQQDARRAGDSNPIRGANPGLPVVGRSRQPCRFTLHVREPSARRRWISADAGATLDPGCRPFGGSSPLHPGPLRRVVVFLGRPLARRKGRGPPVQHLRSVPVPATATPARAEVDRQREFDSRHHPTCDLLLRRVAAVLDAEEASRRREEGAAYALRQSLIDVAATAEALAAELPAPSPSPAPDPPTRPAGLPPGQGVEFAKHRSWGLDLEHLALGKARRFRPARLLLCGRVKDLSGGRTRLCSMFEVANTTERADVLPQRR